MMPQGLWTVWTVCDRSSVGIISIVLVLSMIYDSIVYDTEIDSGSNNSV